MTPPSRDGNGRPHPTPPDRASPEAGQAAVPAAGAGAMPVTGGTLPDEIPVTDDEARLLDLYLGDKIRALFD